MQLKISFEEAGPEVYEYPSESSLLLDDSPVSSVQTTVGHTVPNLGGKLDKHFKIEGNMINFSEKINFKIIEWEFP